MIEGNKVLQEAATLAFTIVTLIFLPLTIVATFLGMNTADIRELKVTQWVYWVAAIPMTALFIIFILYALG